MSEHPPPGQHARLRMTSRAENVAVVRAMLTGIADSVGLSYDVADGIRTAVSEACNNVVMHAYDGAPGPMQVGLTLHRDSVEVVVTDWGSGIKPHAALDDAATMLGVGLSVVQAFTDSVELRGAPGAGTEVRMQFDVARGVTPPAGTLPDEQPSSAPIADGSALLTLVPSPLVAPILAQVAAALAARARFTLDRLSDAQLLTDAIAAHAPHACADGRLAMRIDSVPRAVEMRVGPLEPAAAEHLLADAGPSGLRAIAERLSDGARIEPGQEGDTVVVRLDDQRRVRWSTPA